MPRTEFYAPSDVDVLRMENDLLSHEVRYLRARMEQGADRQMGPAAQLTDRDLERAYNDMRWFVDRLDSSIVGPILRLWPGFRTLRDRYLQTDA